MKKEIPGKRAGALSDIPPVWTPVFPVLPELKSIRRKNLSDIPEEEEKAYLLGHPDCEAGADFVKTSTGFGTGGATEKAVKLMRETVGKDMGVKASGGVRTKADMDKMIKAGANRIGASAGVKIMEEYNNE